MPRLFPIIAVRLGPDDSPLFTLDVDLPVGQVVLDDDGSFVSLALEDLTAETVRTIEGCCSAGDAVELAFTPLGRQPQSVALVGALVEATECSIQIAAPSSAPAE